MSELIADSRLRRRRAPRRPDRAAAGQPPPFVDLNGIDFLEVDAADHRILRVSS